ncbi:hypothetical protein MAR_021997, partial [Mya arenaria]
EAEVTNFTILNVYHLESFEVNENTLVILYCQAESNPLSNIVLSKQSQNLKIANSTSDLEFTISKSVCEDEGTYQCTAQNTHNTKAHVRCSPCIVIVPKRPERHKRYRSACITNS